MSKAYGILWLLIVSGLAVSACTKELDLERLDRTEPTIGEMREMYIYYYEDFVYTEFSGVIDSYKAYDSATLFAISIKLDGGSSGVRKSLTFCRPLDPNHMNKKQAAFFPIVVGDSVRKEFGSKELMVKRSSEWTTTQPMLCDF